MDEYHHMRSMTRVNDSARAFAAAFKAAVQFLTVVPVWGEVRFDPRAMSAHFPLVGLLLGLLVAGFDALGHQVWSLGVVSGLDMIALLVLTGALHVDGLGDSADGLFSHRSRERALEIMKDSRIGVMGLVTILAVLGMKWAGLSELHSQRWLMICLVPAYSRAGMLVAMRILPYGRPEGGTGRDFCDRHASLRTYWMLPVLVVLSLFLGWRALVINGLFVLTTAALLLFYARKIGCITGDTLGALNEVLEAVLFLGVSV